MNVGKRKKLEWNTRSPGFAMPIIDIRAVIYEREMETLILCFVGHKFEPDLMRTSGYTPNIPSKVPSFMDV